MKTATMLELLSEREEELRSTLRANSSMDKSSEACAETIDRALTELLLRYNASCSDNRMCQAAADSLTAAARSAAALVKAGRAEKSTGARQIAGWAILAVLVSAFLCTAAVLLIQRAVIWSYVCMAAAVLLAYLGGRFWFKTSEVTVHPTVDPDQAWYTLRQTVETMDKKVEDLCACTASVGEKAEPDGGGALSAEELSLFAGLLEALYANNGDFALRQLARVPDYMESRGVTLVEYSPEEEHYFECFPTRREAATQRPAMLAGEKLLLMGKAIKPAEQTKTRR